MSQPTETTNNSPQPPIEGPTRTTSPSNRRPSQPPQNPITDEQRQRLHVLSELVPQYIIELRDKLNMMVTYLTDHLTPQQQMQEPAKLALESRERYSAFIDDLLEEKEILFEYMRYGCARTEFAETYARELQEREELWVGRAEFWKEQAEWWREVSLQTLDLWRDLLRGLNDIECGN